jgi:hypothetical protein
MLTMIQHLPPLDVACGYFAYLAAVCFLAALALSVVAP